MSRAVILVVAVLGTLSCVSQSRKDPLAFEKAALFGMVYDEDNQPCGGVAVAIDGRVASTTDIRGRFVLPELGRGEHRLEARKAGYEELSLDFQFLHQTDVLYLKMTSFTQLLTMVESALEERLWNDAANLLARAAKLNGADPVFGYLRSLLAYDTDHFEEAAGYLDALVAGGVREAHVYLLLADIYERHLHKPELAAANLKAYLELRSDPEAEKRLEEIGRTPSP